MILATCMEMTPVPHHVQEIVHLFVEVFIFTTLFMGQDCMKLKMNFVFTKILLDLKLLSMDLGHPGLHGAVV